MTKQEITEALLATEPAYQELATRVTNSDILYALYSETDNINLKNRVISLLVMQSHADLSSFLAGAFEQGDLAVKTTVVANLSSLPDVILNSSRIQSILAKALTLDDVGLLKFAIKVIKSRDLQQFHSSLNRISEQSSNEYLRTLINSG